MGLKARSNVFRKAKSRHLRKIDRKERSLSSINLNAGQRECLEKFTRTSRNLFITGPGGSGKSEVLKQIRDLLSAEEVAVLAPTGIAAKVIGGKTWHSYFGVGILEGGLRQARDRALANDLRNEKFRSISTIILDEISFIREEELRLMNWILQSARGNKLPMGGVRVIAFGDFFQLPPVTKAGEYGKPHFAFQESKQWFESRNFHVWKALDFHQISLTENMRSHDEEYSRLLRYIRDGVALPDDLKQILLVCQGRYRDAPDATKDYLQIFSRNDDVERHNLQLLAGIPGKEFIFRASYFGDQSFYGNQPIPCELRLKVGARVIVRKNDYDAGIMNGELGHVSGLREDMIQVRTDSGVLMDLVKTEFAILDADYRRRATAVQFPLSLAYAISVHRSQGQTVSGPVVLDLSNHWETGQSYVALSRVKKRDQVFIKGAVDFKKLIARDPNVVRFYKGEYSPSVQGNAAAKPNQESSAERQPRIGNNPRKSMVRRTS